MRDFVYSYDKFGNLAARKDNINNVEETFTYDDIDRLTGVTLNGKERILTYLTGPYGVFAVVEKSDGEEKVHYIYKDHLGSWTTITDSDGKVEQRQSFDAWGNRRNAQTWFGEATDEPMFDRGFTGHEHLYNFGLINMNGRMYDPLTSSFLSPDNYVQDPTSQQSFNRYAYCVYNPLKYVDPSGERRCSNGEEMWQGIYEEILRQQQSMELDWESTMMRIEMWMTKVFSWGDKNDAVAGGNDGSGGGGDGGNGGNAAGGGGGNGRKEYESPISDNCGKQNGECVYRCLEEFSESYGIKGGDFDYWCNLATQVLGRETIKEDGGVVGVHPNDINKLVNSSDCFSSEEIYREDIDSMIYAFDKEDSRLMIAIPGHAAMIQSITIDRNGYYMMRFAETSCYVRYVPYYSCNLTRDIPGCRIFKISLKP